MENKIIVHSEWALTKKIFTTLLGMVFLRVLQAGLKSCMGRAGRDGHPATATVYYSTDTTNHAMAWIQDHVGNADYCKQLLEGFSSPWKYVMANLAGNASMKYF